MPTRKHTRFRINCSKVWKHPKLWHEFSIIEWTIPLSHTESDWLTKINIKKEENLKRNSKRNHGKSALATVETNDSGEYFREFLTQMSYITASNLWRHRWAVTEKYTFVHQSQPTPTSRQQTLVIPRVLRYQFSSLRSFAITFAQKLTVSLCSPFSWKKLVMDD